MEKGNSIKVYMKDRYGNAAEFKGKLLNSFIKDGNEYINIIGYCSKFPGRCSKHTISKSRIDDIKFTRFLGKELEEIKRMFENEEYKMRLEEKNAKYRDKLHKDFSEMKLVIKEDDKVGYYLEANGIRTTIESLNKDSIIRLLKDVDIRYALFNYVREGARISLLYYLGCSSDYKGYRNIYKKKFNLTNI